MLESIVKTFTEKYTAIPRVFRSPGRVNIIGEHTDYNEGFVLPGAINKHIWVGIGKRNDNKINLFASDYNELHSFDVTNIQRSAVQWTNYILGVADQLQKAGCILNGFDLVIDGDVPVGAGLSSSAAVECAVIYALNELFELTVDKIKMVHMAQNAEHSFAGVQCGIMDQFASMMGKKDHVIKLDCRSLNYEYIPCKLEGYKIVLFNSNVKHNLASSEYNVRRQQCEQGVRMLQQFYPEIKSLRDVNMKMLDEHIADAEPLIYQRCKYVVEENARLLMACDYLTRGNITALGKKIFESHEGLSKDYEVSCKELDFLVDLVKINPSVAGARMMGGGFGGCTINLVKEDAIEKLIDSVKTIYEKETKLPLTTYIAEIDNGTSEVH